jgi:hypothetical protein
VGGNVSELSSAQPAPTAVSLTEYQIEMPTSLSAGIHLFSVANNGGGEHNLTVEGQDIEHAGLLGASHLHGLLSSG